MEKDYFYDHFPSGKGKKFLKVMKLKALLLFCSMGSIVAAPVFPQNAPISVSYTDKTIIEILSDLEKQTGYDFFYQKEIIPSSMKATVTMNNASLEQVLSKILSENNLVYQIKDDHVIIGPAPVSPAIDQPTSQQPRSITIRAKVVDKDRVPIPGVAVRIKNSQSGSVTNREGMVVITMLETPNTVLIFTFTGLKTQEITYTGQELIQVVMEEQIMDIKEVVVTGYGEVPKDGYTGNSLQINQGDLQKSPQGNLIEILSTFDSGFKIVTNNRMGSDPNTLPEYYMRGRTGPPGLKQLDAEHPVNPNDLTQFALTSNPSEPIFILDGFEVSSTKIYDLDMNRIESVTLLKDATATAIYGSRAGNGVVVVQTIAPVPGEVRIMYSGEMNATFPDLTSYDLLNAAEAVEAERLAGLFGGSLTGSTQMAQGVIAYQRKMNMVYQGIDTDWISKPLRSSYNHRHTISISGGSQELRYGLDLNYNRNDGVMKGSSRNTMGASMTVDYRWNSLQVMNKVEVSRMTSEDSPYGSFSDYVRMKPYVSPYDDQGNFVKWFTLPTASNLSTRVTNPLYESTVGNFYNTKYTEIMDYLSLIWRSSNRFWMVKGNMKVSFNITDADKFISPYSATYLVTTAIAETLTGMLSTSETRETKWNTDVSLNYNRYIGDHNINCQIAGEAAETVKTVFGAIYKGFVNEIGSPSQAVEIENKPTYRDSRVRRLSTFLMANYSFRNIYLFDVSGRLDGSSVFGSDRKIAPFWATGFGLNIHNYGFLADNNWLNQLKLTATYGQTGKANFEPYQAKIAFDPILDGHYATSLGMMLKSFGNTNLKWEKKRTWNFKAEVGLFRDVVNLQFVHYRERTIDLVEDVTIPASSGFRVFRSNVGEVMNKGYEFRVNLRVLNTEDWKVVVINDISRNTNKIVKIGEALENYNKRIDSFFGNYNLNTRDVDYGMPFTKYEEGNSLSAIYGMKSLGIDPARGLELYLKRDGTPTNTWSSAEQQSLGDTEPKVNGNLHLNVQWKQLELYAAFQYQWGGQVYNQTYQAIENIDLSLYSGDRRVLTETWKKVGDVTKLVDITRRYMVTRPTSRFVQDNDMFQMTSLSLMYHVKGDWLKRMKLGSARITLSTTNIAIISSVKQERGTAFPYARTYKMNLFLQF